MLKIDDIISSLSTRDKSKLGLCGDYCPNFLLRRFLLEEDEKPAGFLDISGNTNGIAITIAVNPAFRHKGYGKKLVLAAKSWIDSSQGASNSVVWWTRQNNTPSIKLAEVMGLKLDRSSVINNNPWIMYSNS